MVFSAKGLSLNRKGTPVKFALLVTSSISRGRRRTLRGFWLTCSDFPGERQN